MAVAAVGEEEVAAFRTAVIAYVRAVDLADRARAEWYAADRPVVFRQPNGALGVHPLVGAIVSTSRAVMRHAGELGLTPMSAAGLGRLGLRRGPGRPVGANSAPDRRDSLPAPIQRNDRPGMVLVTGGSKHADGGGVDAAAIDRARGHVVDE